MGKLYTKRERGIGSQETNQIAKPFSHFGGHPKERRDKLFVHVGYAFVFDGIPSAVSCVVGKIEPALES
ncbi:MAG TPA: hypothetical protein VII12_12665 [Thermoanaerobaculia bacterium]